MTSIRLSELAGYASGFVSDFENGRVAPKWHHVDALAKALGVSTEKLVGTKKKSKRSSCITGVNPTSARVPEKWTSGTVEVIATGPGYAQEFELHKPPSDALAHVENHIAWMVELGSLQPGKYRIGIAGKGGAKPVMLGRSAA